METHHIYPHAGYLASLVIVAACAFELQAQPVGTNCVPRPDGLISWWRAEGNADDAAGLNSGTLLNGTGFGMGEVGQTFTFDGVNQLVTVPDAPSLNPTNALTLEGWVYLMAFSGNDAVVVAGKDDPYGARQYMLGLGTFSNFWSFRAHIGVPGGYQYFNGATPIQTGLWYHVAMTYDGAALRLYLNGQLDGSIAVTGPITTTSNPLLIGGHAGGPWNFNGLVDELSLYNRALSQAEIQGIFNAGSAGKCPTAPSTCVAPSTGMISWWRAEGDAADAVGGNNGSLFPGTGFASGNVGDAFNFDGENSAVVVPAAANLAVQSLTIEGWIVITDTVLARPIVEFANPTGPCAMNMWYNIKPGVQGNSAGLYGFFRDDGGNAVDLGTAPGVLQSNQWNHVALTFQANPSNDVLALYVNGGIVGVTTSSVPVLWNSFENVNLGYRPVGSSDLWGGRRHLGLLDEVSIYNRALSASEIQAIYNAGSAGKCAAVLPPTISTHPTDQTVVVGGSATFSVGASSTAPLSYLWRFNGGALLGQTGTSLLLTNVQLAQAGNYSVVVTNQAGTAVSSNAVLTVLAPTTNCVPPPPGLVGWWRAEGNYSDSAGTNNGTPINSVSIQPGLVGQAFQFVSGPNPRVYIPDSPTLQLTNGLTIEAWLKPNLGWIILARGDDVTGEVPYLLGFDDVSSLRPSFLIKESVNNGVFLKATTSLPTNVWVHVAATLDGSTGDMIIYANGQIVAQTNTTIRPICPLTGANRSVCIGNAGGTAGFPFDGLIDEVSLYSRALSQAEIQAIYTAGSAGKCAAVVPPTIFTQPTDQTVVVGGSTTFSVGASGTAPLSYQWRFNGGALLGQTGTSLLLTNVQLAQEGNYSVVVTNQAGSVISSNAVLTVLAPSTNCVAPPPGLVGWWRAEGNYSDSAGTNNGTPINSVSIQPGLVGQAFQFVSGPNPRVYIPDSPTLQLTNGLTIEAWLKPNLGWTVLARGDDVTGEVPYFLGFDDVSSLRLGFLVKSGVNNGEFLRTTNSLPTNVWVHVAATLDDNTGDMRIYINGQVAAETTTTIRPTCPLTGANSSVCIGNVGGTAGFPFDGLIDEVSLYSRGLSQAEVQAIYAAGSAGKCTAVLPPTIFTQPTDQTVTAGGSATFSVGASGTAPLSYQWRFNGGALLGQTGTSLLLTNVQLAQAGNYSVLVTNQAGTAASSNAVLTVLGPTTNCVPAPPGLVGWWPGEGDARDVVGGENGSIGGATTFTPGKVGQAFSFDGATSTVTVPASSNLAVSSFTVEAWIFPNDISQPRPVVEYANPTGPGYIQLWYGITAGPGGGVGSPGALYALLRDPGGAALQVGSAAGLILSNQWSHVALTYDIAARMAELYVNGVNVGSDSSAVPVEPSTSVPVNIGYRPEGSSELLAGTRHLGRIDEVTIYSRALSSSEIGSIFLADSAGKCRSPLPPLIVSEPPSQTAHVGQTVSFNVAAGGDAPLSYQWLFNGGSLSGQTSSMLSLNSVQLTNGGNYSVLVSNVAGSVLSSNATLTVLPTPNCDPPAPGLVGWWPGQGGGQDIIGGDNATIGGTVTFVPGEVAQAFHLDATSMVTASASSNLAVGSFTIEAWLNPVDINNPRPVVEYADPTGPGYIQLWYGFRGAGGAPGALHGLLRDPGGAALQVDSAANLLASNQWSHVALTYDIAARIAQLYLNGVNVGSNMSAVAVVPNTLVPVNIGYRPPGSSELLAGTRHLGGLDEISIYNRVLAPAEIEGIYVAGSAGKCPPPPVCDPAPTNLVSWWRAEGDASDSADSNNGTLLGGVAFTPGEVGEAFSFDGSGAHIEVPNSPALQLTNELTLELWYKDTGSPAGNHYYGLIAKRAPYPQGANFGINFYLGSPSQLQVYFQDPVYPSYQISSSPVPAAGVFHHLAATYAQIAPEQVEAKTYVDGQLVQTSDLPGNLDRTLNTTPVTIGSDNPGEDFFVGLIDEASIYRRALTATEINGIYNAGRAGKCRANGPIAGNAFVKVLENEVALIRPRRILDWCSSPDHYPLTISAVSPTSTQGASVMLVTNGVVYHAPTNYLGYDQFDYSISDGHGGSASASAIVYIDPRRAASATLLVPTPIAGGLQVSFTGYADRTYTIERAESLDGPWITIDSITVDGDGAGTFTDPDPPAGNAYYRAVFQ
jgi:hypothetical protein